EALLLDLGRLLADAVAKVIQPRAPHNALAVDLDLFDVRRIDRENTFDAFAIRNAADGESLTDSGPAPGNHDSRENLDPLLVALAHARVDTDAVAHLERGKIRPDLVLGHFFNYGFHVRLLIELNPV